MTPYVHYYAVNLRDGMRLERERHPVAQGDALADRFVVTVMDDTTPVDLTGVGVSAMVIRADGVSVPVTGQVEDGSAVVTLTDECYDVSGCITITVTIESGDIRQSVLQVVLNVATSETDIVADTDVLHFADILAAAERAEAAADRAEAAGGGSGGGGGSGEDGFSPIANVQQMEDGALITITDKNGTTEAFVPNGVDGQDGYTPVKGTDYYTAADKADMVQSVIAALPVYGGEVGSA